MQRCNDIVSASSKVARRSAMPSARFIFVFLDWTVRSAHKRKAQSVIRENLLSVWFQAISWHQARDATTDRYSAWTTVNSSPARLCEDHNPSSSARSRRASVSSKEANARFVGPSY